MIALHPALFEFLTLLVMGASGVGLGVLFGWRHPLLLAGMAVGVSGSVRVLSALVVWSAGHPEWLIEAWWVASVPLAAGAGVLAVRREARSTLLGGATFLGMAVVALAVKYVLDIGERHHRDSASMIELAQLIFQIERDVSEAGGPEKRGLMYPLLLALGPEGRILSAATPLILLSIVALSVWLTLRLTASVDRRFVWAGIGLVGLFSLTVPIARVALTYLNSHTMMALGVLALVGGVVLVRHAGRFTPSLTALLAIGVIIGTTARIEGIVSVLVILASLVGSSVVRGIQARVTVFSLVGLAGVSLAWWMSAYDSPVLTDFGVTSLAVAGVALAGGALVALPFVDRVRPWLFTITIAVVFGMILRVMIQSGNPFLLIDAQRTNVLLGYGGWGVAASALGASLILLGWRARSESYRRLAVMTVLLIFTMLVAKIFDGGGFGREGFYDSVNRMWLHTIGVAAVTMAVGYAEVLQAAVRGSWPWSRRSLSAVYTSPENRSVEDARS